MRRAQHRAPCCRPRCQLLIFTIVLVLLLSAVLASLAADGPNHITLYLPGLLVVLFWRPHYLLDSRGRRVVPVQTRCTHLYSSRAALALFLRHSV